MRKKMLRGAAALLISGAFVLPPALAQAADPPGLAGESAPPTAPATDPSDIQERAIRDLRELGTFTPSPKSPPPVATPAPPSAPSTGGGGPLPVVGGTVEPDYRYPWVVRLGGCGGVLIDPQWVLTAAHCVTPGIGFGSVTYKRTDPFTGAVKTETRGPNQSAGPTNNRGVFIHPMFNNPGAIDNDIALVKLAQPFAVNPYIQTVGLPRSPRQQGVVGTVANFSHSEQLPPGQFAIFRAPIPLVEYAPKIYISATGTSLCPGDSGSGFVTVENVRAMVRGIASQASITDCKTPSGEAVFTDVFTFRDWILQTMGKSDAVLAGNTRVRWSGRAARGVMGIGCIPIDTMWGPLNVVGVEEGAVCEAGQTQTVMCNLEKNQGNTGVLVPKLSGLTMRTTMANGTSEVKTFPASGNTASFFGPFPAGASRDFTCQIATPFTVPTTGTNLPVLSRGIEGESAVEPTVEQPTPFYATEETTQK